MLHLMPKQLPPIEYLLDDMGTTDHKIAKALGVTHRTLRRYRAAEQAPRVVMLALFWVSRWGQSLLNAEAWRGHDIYRDLAKALKHERDDLLQQLGKVGELAEFGSANDPSPLIPSVMRASAPRARPSSPLAVTPLDGDLSVARRRLAKLQRRLERRRRREGRERAQRRASALKLRAERVARSRARRQARKQHAA